MNLRPRKADKSVLLPWERRRGFLAAGPLSSAYGSLVWGPIALVLILALGWQAADRRARVRATRVNISEVQQAISAFRAEIGRCPRVLTELLHPPRSAARYLTDLPRDAWDRELYVRCPSSHDPNAAEVVSAGPSGSFSDDDNIF
jgi:type II secretory pathway pseudopilin PulG